MSDFMKSIVAEVLERNRPNRHAPAVIPVSSYVPVHAPAASSTSADSRADCKVPCMKPGNCAESPGGIKRINYQKERAAKRLAPLGLPGIGSSVTPSLPRLPDQTCSSGFPCPSRNTTYLPDASEPLQAGNRSLGRSAGAVAAPSPPAGTASGDNQSFAERCLSPLLLRTLPSSALQPSKPSGAEARRTSIRPAEDLPRGPDSFPGAARVQLITDSSESLYDLNPHSPDIPVHLIREATLEAWLFPAISSRLRAMFGTAGRSYTSAGVLSIPASHPGQLFTVEELLTRDPVLEADIQWSANGGGFELHLFSSDSVKLAARLAELAAVLKRDSARQIRVYSCLQPGPLLRRYLAAGQQDAVAVVDAGSRWNSISLAEQWLDSSPDVGLCLRAERSYCIISGTSAKLAGILPALTALEINAHQQ